MARRWNIRVSSSRVHSTLKLFCLFWAFLLSFTRHSAKQALSGPLQMLVCFPWSALPGPASVITLKSPFMARLAWSTHSSVAFWFHVHSCSLSCRLFAALQWPSANNNDDATKDTATVSAGFLLFFSNIIQVPEMGMGLGCVLRLPRVQRDSTVRWTLKSCSLLLSSSSLVVDDDALDICRMNASTAICLSLTGWGGPSCNYAPPALPFKAH